MNIPFILPQREVSFSSMKTKILTLLFFLFIIGFVVYVKYDTKKFIKNLPQVPAAQPTEVPAIERSTSQSEVGDVLRSIEQNALEPGTDVPHGNHTHGHAHDHIHDHGRSEHLEIPVVPQTRGDVDDSIVNGPTITEEQQKKYTQEQFENPYERVKIMRPWLVETYGDTLEVNTFLELEVKINTAKKYPVEDAIKHAELQAKFYPFPENQEFVESTKRSVAHAVDGFFYNPDPDTAIFID